MERIDRIVITEDNVKANLKRTKCKECGREYFMALASDGSVVQPCPVCLGLFEKVRTKRNGINYYGTPVSYEDWEEVELQYNLYAKKLKEEIRKKITR